jgi:hypothetical protein
MKGAVKYEAIASHSRRAHPGPLDLSILTRPISARHPDALKSHAAGEKGTTGMNASRRLNPIVLALSAVVAVSFSISIAMAGSSATSVVAHGKILDQQLDGQGRGYTVVRLWGSYYEMGYARGELLSDIIVAGVQGIKQFIGTPYEARRSLMAASVWEPIEIEQELDGLVDALAMKAPVAGIDKLDLKVCNALGDVMLACRRQFSGVSGGIAGRQTKGESLSAEEVGDLPQLQSASPPVGSLVDDQNVGTRGSQRLSPTMGFWLVSLRWFCFPRNGESDDSFRRPRCPCGRASRLGQKTRPQGTQGGGGSAAAPHVAFPAESWLLPGFWNGGNIS